MKLIFLLLFLATQLYGAGTYVKGPALIEGTTSTVTAAGTTTLTKDSQSLQQFTGATTQTVTLPNATTIPNGRKIYLFNRSTGAVTINYFGGALAQTLTAGQWVIATLYDNSGSAGVWDFASSPGAAATAITSLTGDVTATGPGASAATIPAGTINNTRMSNVPTATLKGRITAGTGTPEDLTGTQATTLIDAFTSGLKGLAPASGGGSINFLRADGTWAPPGAAAGFTIGSLITSGTANRIVYEDATNFIAEDVDLQFDGDSLTLGKAVIMSQIATPSNPSAGYDKLYFKSDDNLYRLTSAGVETQVGGGLTIGGAITGGTANRVLYEGAGNVIAESTDFRFNGTRLSIPLGSAAAVSLTDTTNDDNDTGIYFSGTGSAIGLAISYNGTQQSRWDSSLINWSNVTGFASLAFNGVTSAFVSDTYFQANKDFGGTTGIKFGKAGANTNTFDSGNLGTGGLAIGIANGGAYTTPNYELDIRGGAGNSTIQLSNTVSGISTTDGVLFDYDGVGLVVNNQETTGYHQFSIDGTRKFRMANLSGISVLTGGNGGTPATMKFYDTNVGYDTPVVMFEASDISPFTGSTVYSGAQRFSGAVNHYPWAATYSKQIMITPTNAGTGLPNYELDVRGVAGDATIQLSNTASGNTSTDGAKIDFDGTNLHINNQEGGGAVVRVSADNEVTRMDVGSSGINITGLSGSGMVLNNTDSGYAYVGLVNGNSVAGGAEYTLQATNELDILNYENKPIRLWTNSIERESVEPSSDVQTTDATVTTLYSKTLTDNTVYLYEARCNSRRTDAADRSTFIRRVSVYREAAGVATIEGAVQDELTRESDAATDLTWDVNSNDVRLRATGVAAKTFNWRCDITYQKVE